LTKTTQQDAVSGSTFNNRKLFAAFFALAAVLLIDVTIGSSQDILLDFAISQAGMALFVAIAAASIFTQLYIIRMVSAKNRHKESRHYHFGRFQIAARIVQYVLAAIMITVILQIVFTAQYYTDLLIAALAISYGLVIALSSVLAYKFFSWFRINKSPVVLLYGLAAALIVINAIDTITLFDGLLIQDPAVVFPQSEVIYEGNFEEGHPMYIQSLIMATTQTGYFLLIWGATVLILYHNIKRLGKIRFWSLVVPPILFFMSFYISFYETLNPPNSEEVPPLIVYILLVIYSMITAGVFFGVGFLSIGRSPKLRGPIKDYMFITGYAFVLFVISSISVIHQAGYPPFGLTAVNTVGMAAFLMLTGLYNSAATVSQDVQLRRLIKNSAKELKLLDSIGSAEMQTEMERKVISIAKQNASALTEKSGIEHSMSDQEIIDYLNQATEELKEKHGAASK
jgi:hypothetical protein